MSSGYSDRSCDHLRMPDRHRGLCASGVPAITATPLSMACWRLPLLGNDQVSVRSLAPDPGLDMLRVSIALGAVLTHTNGSGFWL